MVWAQAVRRWASRAAAAAMVVSDSLLSVGSGMAGWRGRGGGGVWTLGRMGAVGWRVSFVVVGERWVGRGLRDVSLLGG